jgi:hypothetical protein
VSGWGESQGARRLLSPSAAGIRDLPPLSARRRTVLDTWARPEAGAMLRLPLELAWLPRLQALSVELTQLPLGVLPPDWWRSGAFPALQR